MRLTAPQIRALLARYEAAETSLEEERALRAAMAAPELAEEFHAYRAWFGGLEVLANTPAPQRAGPWSEPVVESERTPEPGARIRSISSALATPPPQGRRRSRTRLLWTRLAVAAALIGLLGLGASLLLQRDVTQSPLAEADAAPPETLLDNPPSAIDWSKYEVTDPEEATRITRAALAQVSTRLRRGSSLTAENLGAMAPIHHLHNRKS